MDGSLTRERNDATLDTRPRGSLLSLYLISVLVLDIACKTDVRQARVWMRLSNDGHVPRNCTRIWRVEEGFLPPRWIVEDVSLASVDLWSPHPSSLVRASSKRARYRWDYFCFSLRLFDRKSWAQSRKSKPKNVRPPEAVGARHLFRKGFRTRHPNFQTWMLVFRHLLDSKK